MRAIPLLSFYPREGSKCHHTRRRVQAAGMEWGNYKPETQAPLGCFPGMELGRLIELTAYGSTPRGREKTMVKREPLGQVTWAPVSALSASHCMTSDMGGGA